MEASQAAAELAVSSRIAAEAHAAAAAGAAEAAAHGQPTQGGHEGCGDLSGRLGLLESSLADHLTDRVAASEARVRAAVAAAAELKRRVEELGRARDDAAGKRGASDARLRERDEAIVEKVREVEGVRAELAAAQAALEAARAEAADAARAREVAVAAASKADATRADAAAQLQARPSCKPVARFHGTRLHHRTIRSSWLLPARVL